MINLWLKEYILPTLKKGDVIVMDNTSFHKSQETRDIIKNAECFVLFLSPYSPHLYPVEKLWANIKQAWKYEISRELDRILISSDFIWN
jgi:transposase